MYKPPLRIEPVKPPIDFAAVIERRATGLSIKDCWKVYRKDRPNGFSLTRFSALVKKHAEVPHGFVAVGGPVAVPVNAHSQRIHWPEPIEDSRDGDEDTNPLDGILSVTENGSSIKVRRSELVIGLPTIRDLCSVPAKGETSNGLRFMRATHGLSAVVVEGDAMITTAAMAWLEGQGIDLYIDSPYGLRVFTASEPGAIRKAQYGAGLKDALRIAKLLILSKFTGWLSHQRYAKYSAESFAPPVHQHCITGSRLAQSLLSEVNAAKSVEALRLVEARYSLMYWRSVSPINLKHTASFPTTWRTWNGTRVSSISGVNSSSTHPVNAVLNYSYAILAAKYELAAAAKGLDNCIGALHGNEDGKGARRALVFDLMELIGYGSLIKYSIGCAVGVLGREGISGWD